jgi:hypothetical protein
MLLDLEDAMILGHEPKSNLSCESQNTGEAILAPTESFRLHWGGDQGIMPLAIMGLEYTLSFYYPKPPIELTNIGYLDISNWSVVGISIMIALTSSASELDSADA